MLVPITPSPALKPSSEGDSHTQATPTLHLCFMCIDDKITLYRISDDNLIIPCFYYRLQHPQTYLRCGGGERLLRRNLGEGLLRGRSQSLGAPGRESFAGADVGNVEFMSYDNTILTWLWSYSLQSMDTVGWVTGKAHTVNPRLNAPAFIRTIDQNPPRLLETRRLSETRRILNLAVQACCIKICAAAHWLQQQTDFSTWPIKLVLDSI